MNSNDVIKKYKTPSIERIGNTIYKLETCEVYLQESFNIYKHINATLRHGIQVYW